MNSLVCYRRAAVQYLATAGGMMTLVHLLKDILHCATIHSSVSH